MSNKRITDLTELTTLTANDVFPVVDIETNITKKIKASNVIAPPSGVSGAIQFSNGSAFASDATNLFWDDTNDNLGIGTNNPTHKLTVSDSSPNDGPVFFEKDILDVYSDFYIYNKNGSINLTTGQVIGSLSFGGYFNSAYIPNIQEVATIFSLYRGDGTTRKGSLQFRTHDSSGLQNAMTINENQLVGVGETSPTALLHVKGKGSTSATASLIVQNSGGNEALKVRDDRVIIMSGMPTSALGLPNGALWNDSGTIKIV
jgi:hypothetical protein